MQSVVGKLLLAGPNSFRHFACKAEGLPYIPRQPSIGGAGTGMLPKKTAASLEDSLGATLQVSGRSLQRMSCGELMASAVATNECKLAAVSSVAVRQRLFLPIES